MDDNRLRLFMEDLSFFLFSIFWIFRAEGERPRTDRIGVVRSSLVKTGPQRWSSRRVRRDDRESRADASSRIRQGGLP